MDRLLELIKDLKGDMGARLNRHEARRVEYDQASDASAGSSTFRTNVEALSGLKRNMTLASLEDEVMPGSARQHAAEPRQRRMGGGGGGMDLPPKRHKDRCSALFQPRPILRRRGPCISGS